MPGDVTCSMHHAQNLYKHLPANLSLYEHSECSVAPSDKNTKAYLNRELTNYAEDLHGVIMKY